MGWRMITPTTRSTRPEDAGEDAEHDRRVVRATATRADRRDVVGVVVIEAALHLIEKTLLLFRKRHFRLPHGRAHPVVPTR